MCKKWNAKNTMQFLKYIDMIVDKLRIDYFNWIKSSSDKKTGFKNVSGRCYLR